MTQVIKGELLKVATTRTLPAFALAGVALTIANVVIVALASGALDNVAEKQEALAGLPVLLLLVGVVGAAGEHRHRTAAPAALVAGCGRARLLTVRMGVYGLVGLAMGALMTCVAVGVGLPLLGDQPGPALTTSEVTSVAAGCLAAAVLSAIMGAALGAVLRNQIAGVVGALILNFVVNPLIAMLNETVADCTPFGAAAILARMTHHTPLSTTGAALVLLGWSVPLVAIAVLAERRRDLT